MRTVYIFPCLPAPIKQTKRKNKEIVHNGTNAQTKTREIEVSTKVLKSGGSIIVVKIMEVDLYTGIHLDAQSPPT